MFHSIAYSEVESLRLRMNAYGFTGFEKFTCSLLKDMYEFEYEAAQYQLEVTKILTAGVTDKESKPIKKYTAAKVYYFDVKRGNSTVGMLNYV